MPKLPAIIVAAVWMSWQAAARGEVVVLKNGGHVEGKLLNAKETPRQKYVLELAGGNRVTFDKSQVSEVVHQSAAKEEYEKVRHNFADTVEGQMELATWCRDHHLATERERHLKRVLELDPSHAEAHLLLKHQRIGGVWRSERQHWESQGYVLYQGHWMTPQEQELRERARKAELAEKEWKQRLKRWRAWMNEGREAEALEQIGQITDPFAIKALAEAISKEPVQEYRKRYLDTLARIDTPHAWRILLGGSLHDPDEEVRLTCLDHITERPVPTFVDYYIDHLHDKKNPIVNRAASALGRLKDRSAILPLIDCLITRHEYQVAPAGQGGYNATFGSMNGQSLGGGLSMGNNGPKIEVVYHNNEDVLQALVHL
ncbi:MAG: HEAT repeat domain-containing protein, partial [Candidatus Saccharimonadales bacterium]